MQQINLTKALSADASKILIAANDEHGLLESPTKGNRTPIMPYVNRCFYENEFNQKAKSFFISACKRCGFRTFDVKPEQNDISTNIRVHRAKQSKANALVTFSLNEATDASKFSSSNGFEVFYSTYSKLSTESHRLAEQVLTKFKKNIQTSHKVKTLNTALLYLVNCPSILIKASFMTNFTEAKLMLDPDFQKQTAENACEAVCNFFGVNYASPTALSIRPILKENHRGEDVLYIQQKPYSKLYPLEEIDGIFNKNTTSALKAFQQESGLVADGVVGPKTLLMLKNSAGRNQK